VHCCDALSFDQPLQGGLRPKFGSLNYPMPLLHGDCCGNCVLVGECMSLAVYAKRHNNTRAIMHCKLYGVDGVRGTAQQHWQAPVPHCTVKPFPAAVAVMPTPMHRCATTFLGTGSPLGSWLKVHLAYSIPLSFIYLLSFDSNVPDPISNCFQVGQPGIDRVVQ
jgi:hypothetical protein